MLAESEESVIVGPMRDSWKSALEAVKEVEKVVVVEGEVIETENPLESSQQTES